MTRTIVATLAATLLATGCTTVSDLPDRAIGSATLSRADGTPVGTAQLVEVGNTLTLALTLTALPAGTHGVHLHTIGTCSGPDFASAGGHLNPSGRHHGARAPDGKHLGDLPNVVIKPGGSGTLSADLPGPASDVLASLFDADGTAIVVRADPDDYLTDPAGNSGKRIACGVFRRA